MKIIHMVVGGPKTDIVDLTSYQHQNVAWIGVDRGAKRLLELGITPDIAVGDFDSLTKEEFENIKKKVSKVYQYPAEKDETDTEIGLNWALEESPNIIRIFGATGGRIDQLLANLMMLMKPKYEAIIPIVEIIDRYNYIKMYLPGSYQVEKLPDKKYVAFTTMLPVEGLTLKGFKYSLIDASYPACSALSSNEFSDKKGNFSFKKGMILFSQSND